MDKVGSSSFVNLGHLHANSGLEGSFLQDDGQVLSDFQETELLSNDHDQVENREYEEE